MMSWFGKQNSSTKKKCIQVDDLYHLLICCWPINKHVKMIWMNEWMKRMETSKKELNFFSAMMIWKKRPEKKIFDFHLKSKSNRFVFFWFSWNTEPGVFIRFLYLAMAMKFLAFFSHCISQIFLFLSIFCFCFFFAEIMSTCIQLVCVCVCETSQFISTSIVYVYKHLNDDGGGNYVYNVVVDA